MRLEVGTLAELDASERLAWRAAADRHPVSSPFFDPDIIGALCATQPGVRLARNRSAQPSFLPFTVVDGHGRPPASGPWGTLADYQGIIGGGDASQWFPRGSTGALGIRSLMLDHLAPSAGFEPWVVSTATSPRVDLCDGVPAFRSAAHTTGSGLAAWLRRKESLLRRELGEVRFEAVSTGATASAALHCLRTWKSAQYERSGVADLFAERWVHDGIDRLRDLPSHGPASALVSVLSVADRPVAAHLGLVSADVVHWWLPAYDPTLSRYSPGALLLARLSDWAAAGGRCAVDLGKGDESYKARFADSAVPLAKVLVRPDGWRRPVRAVRRMMPRPGSRSSA